MSGLRALLSCPSGPGGSHPTGQGGSSLLAQGVGLGALPSRCPLSAPSSFGAHSSPHLSTSHRPALSPWSPWPSGAGTSAAPWPGWQGLAPEQGTVVCEWVWGEAWGGRGAALPSPKGPQPSIGWREFGHLPRGLRALPGSGGPPGGPLSHHMPLGAGTWAPVTLALTVQGSPPPSPSHSHLLSLPSLLPSPGPTSSSLSHCSSSPLSSWTVLAPTFPPAHLFPLLGLRAGGGGCSWGFGHHRQTLGPLPRYQPSGNPSLQAGAGGSTQRVKAVGGRGWARSWAALLKEGAGAGNSHPTYPPAWPSPTPPSPLPPRGQEELPAGPSAFR